MSVRHPLSNPDGWTFVTGYIVAGTAQFGACPCGRRFPSLEALERHQRDCLGTGQHRVDRAVAAATHPKGWRP